MEKPGGPEGAPRHLKPEKPDQSWILIKPVGDPNVARMARQRKRCITPFPTFCEEIPRKYQGNTMYRQRPRLPAGAVTPDVGWHKKRHPSRLSPGRVNGVLDGTLDGLLGRRLLLAL